VLTRHTKIKSRNHKILRHATQALKLLVYLSGVETLRLSIRSGENLSAENPAIAQCAAILHRGGLVAIPTETVYGLAVNALDPAAVARIFNAKGRPRWDPLIVHVSDFEMVSRVVREFPERAQKLAQHFWPGPLTLLFQKTADVPSSVTAGRETIAVRMPAHPVAHALIAAADLPLAAPSANCFGRISPTTADHVLTELDGRIDAVLDAGPTEIGVESTVLDPLRTPSLLLRPGGITREQIEAVVGPVEIYSPPAHSASPQDLASPGLAAKHYAPAARLVLIDGERAALLNAVRNYVGSEGERGQYVGIMAPDHWIDETTLAAGGIVLFAWGSWGDWQQLGRNLFAGLRYLDKPGVSVILCPLPSGDGMGLAVRDRLTRAGQT
jgi:L-threonylcarbamoyladenylate synthase